MPNISTGSVQATNLISLVKELKEGNEEAFKLLVNQYKTYIYSIAYNRIRNFTEAEEITQMVFIEIFNHIRDLKDTTKFLSWLHGITERVSLNWLRQYHRKRAISLNQLGEIASENNPLETFSRQEEYEEAMKIYNSLEPETRLVLNLRYMEDLSYDQIAQRLGVSKDAVRGRLYRAHQTLRRLIK